MDRVLENQSPGDVLRTTRLPRDRVLTVRPAVPADVGDLESLYAQLSPDERYRRFFSMWHPPWSFFEKLANARAAGGLELVAEVTGPEPGPAVIVGEAGYQPLPDGNGELAMVVAAGWRGWLGPYLLDALLDAAAEMGVPNLEAEALVTNSPMIRLMRSRDCAFLDRDDYSTVRMVIGTGPDGVRWAGDHSRRRVLVEGLAVRTLPEEVGERGTFDLMRCPGPITRGGACPALGFRPCPLAGGADTIVVSPSMAGDDCWQALADAHRVLHPEASVVWRRRPLMPPQQPGVASRSSTKGPCALPRQPSNEEHVLDANGA